MSRRHPSNDPGIGSEQESLIECLREEARRTRPEFQPALHRRIWDAVSQARAAQSPPSPAPRARSTRRTISALATAATLLVAVYLVSNAPSPTKAPPRPGPGLVLLMGSPHVGAQHVDEFLSEVGSSDAWTSLRHDAQLAWNTFTEDFPLTNGRKRPPRQDTPPL